MTPRTYFWSAEEDEIVRTMYGAGDLAGLRVRLSYRTSAAIASRAKLLGVKRRIVAPFWSPEQDAALRVGYPAGDLDELAAATGRSIKAIRGRAKKLKLRRCATVTRELHRAHGLEAVVDTSSFVPQALAVRTPLEQCWGSR